MTGRVLVLAALRNELSPARAPKGVDVIYTGVGKVNAASITTGALLASRPSLVVNYGTAGGIAEGLHGLLEVARVIQRDMVAEPIAPRGVTPFSDDPLALETGFGTITCGTGDSFVTAGDPWLAANGVHVVDMELFAIAHVCHKHAVDWRAFKFISDFADSNAADHWQENVAKGEALFWEKLREIL
ncbi:5'-methylthioadenosine nucleosidase [Bradyrhizobium sp. LHD-71]|uniref:phosphorylase family protein n=1 Tax=Bradyrhizobium sp. LHD-71 TaxID=3072141 RepID=UPI00280F174A|nr:5'-methylthioadenosine nucleosidase [Bradyrhizobium sp. LHD-71]MDQ8727258.1 5'-methylthioadenosine nucleosidase [Bradyrhizobium sp. LHD-71]